MTPALRRRTARVGLVASLVAWAACRVGYQLGWIDPVMLDQITNDISWLAITLTLLDVLASTDIRVQQEETS